MEYLVPIMSASFTTCPLFRYFGAKPPKFRHGKTDCRYPAEVLHSGFIDTTQIGAPALS